MPDETDSTGRCWLWKWKGTPSQGVWKPLGKGKKMTPLQSLQKEWTLVNPLILPHWDPLCYAWPPKLWDNIHLCCFKPQKICYNLLQQPKEMNTLSLRLLLGLSLRLLFLKTLIYSLIAQLVKNPPAVQDPWVGNPGGSAGEGIGYPLQYSWASLVAQLVKNPPAMRETWVQSLGWEDSLEKGKATHSTILTCRIPWTVWCRKESDTTEQTFTSVSL